MPGSLIAPSLRKRNGLVWAAGGAIQFPGSEPDERPGGDPSVTLLNLFGKWLHLTKLNASSGILDFVARHQLSTPCSTKRFSLMLTWLGKRPGAPFASIRVPQR